MFLQKHVYILFKYKIKLQQFSIQLLICGRIDSWYTSSMYAVIINLLSACLRCELVIFWCNVLHCPIHWFDHCLSGLFFSGCKLGFYGNNCSTLCNCSSVCLCDPVTGVCNYSSTHNDYLHGEYILSYCLYLCLDRAWKLSKSLHHLLLGHWCGSLVNTTPDDPNSLSILLQKEAIPLRPNNSTCLLCSVCKY